ncbi:hypothetical protein [Luteitalea sp.]
MDSTEEQKHTDADQATVAPAITVLSPEVQSAARLVLEGLGRYPENGGAEPAPTTSREQGGIFTAYFSPTGARTELTSGVPAGEMFCARRFSTLALPRLLNISAQQASEWTRAGVLPRPDGMGTIEPEFANRTPYGLAPQFSRGTLEVWARRVLAGLPANPTWAELAAARTAQTMYR